MTLAPISSISTLDSDPQHPGAGTYHLTGTFYGSTSSRAQQVAIRLDVDGVLRIESPGLVRTELDSACALSEPLGQMPRHFTLPDGARIEIADLETLAAWERSRGRTSGLHFVHLLESRWRWVGVAAVFLLGFILIGYFWGLPSAANHVARQLPNEAGALATSQARRIFIRLFDFEDSKLPVGRREMIEKRFKEMAITMRGGDFNYRMEFFDAAVANAFALPDGLVCVTDRLIEKAKDDREIFGVLAHEIVHVREHHGMRSVLQNSAVFLVWTLMTGDLSTVTSVGAALPTMLAQSGYSRQFELEADKGAADYMIHAGWGTKPLSEMLKRIDPERPMLGGATEAISSHPVTEKRIRILQDMEEGTNARK